MFLGGILESRVLILTITNRNLCKGEVSTFKVCGVGRVFSGIVPVSGLEAIFCKPNKTLWKDEAVFQLRSMPILG
jgi:hypothetical protein